MPAGAQENRTPSARLVPAPEQRLPIDIDSNTPVVRDLVDGVPTLFMLASWGGVSSRLSGQGVDTLQQVDPVSIDPAPGGGVWMEAIVPDEAGAWYGFYHHEVPADVCGRPDRTILSIGEARSRDRGLTWENLGVILEGPPGSQACGSANRFLLGGVGDPSAMLDADGQYLYLFFSQYGKDASQQGVAIARMPWADRDMPAGEMAVMQDGAWLPAQAVDAAASGWIYSSGTALVPVTRPWHDADPRVDAFWGAAVHWNTYLNQYVMLLNRAKNENFDNEGIYVSYAPALGDPHAWSAPQKLMNGGGWYPEVVGLEPDGTDRLAGQRVRFFLTGRSASYLEFSR